MKTKFKGPVRMINIGEEEKVENLDAIAACVVVVDSEGNPGYATLSGGYVDYNGVCERFSHFVDSVYEVTGADILEKLESLARV